MGCDVHGFIEIRTRNAAIWTPFAKLYLPRNYEIFARLAGVRGGAESAVVPQRGLPPDVSAQTSHDCTLYIVYSNDQKPGDHSVGFDDAGKWVSQGKSRFFGQVARVSVTRTRSGGLPETNIYNAGREGQPSHITDPDFHSFTWLSTAEFDQAVNGVSDTPPDYLAASSAINKLQEAGYEVRVILWFDN